MYRIPSLSGVLCDTILLFLISLLSQSNTKSVISYMIWPFNLRDFSVKTDTRIVYVGVNESELICAHLC